MINLKSSGEERYWTYNNRLNFEKAASRNCLLRLHQQEQPFLGSPSEKTEIKDEDGIVGGASVPSPEHGISI